MRFAQLLFYGELARYALVRRRKGYGNGGHASQRNQHQHFTTRGAFMPGFLAGKGREDKTGKQAYL